MIRMVVTDIDGTIYTPEQGITQEVKACIRKLTDNGIPVAIATGRGLGGSKTIIEELGIKCPMICYQGGLICSCDDEVLDVKYLDEELARQIVKELRAQNIHMNVYIEDVLFVENDNDYIKDYVGNKGIDYFKVETFDTLDFTKLNKILAIDKDPQLIENLIKDLQAKYPQLYIVKSTNIFCEIANKEATKGNAIKFLANKLGFTENEVMAIGDQNNDIEMVITAGVGVAMGNGTEEIKAKADYITDTVSNNGFVKAVNKFVWSKDNA